MSSLRALSKTFYWMCALAVIERAIWSFMANASQIFQSFYFLGLGEAGILLSIPNIILVILSPVFAIVFDRIGKRGFGFILGFVVLIFGNLVFMFGQCNPDSFCYS